MFYNEGARPTDVTYLSSTIPGLELPNALDCIHWLFCLLSNPNFPILSTTPA